MRARPTCSHKVFKALDLPALERPAKAISLPSSTRHLPPDEGSEIAFAGRSNAGKSSALNALCEQVGLARTSKTPGRTQALVVFELDTGKRLIDLPGYGYAKVPEAMRDHWRRAIDPSEHGWPPSASELAAATLLSGHPGGVAQVVRAHDS